MAATIAATLAGSRPSEIFGTHSISRFIGIVMRAPQYSIIGDFHPGRPLVPSPGTPESKRDTPRLRLFLRFVEICDLREGAWESERRSFRTPATGASALRAFHFGGGLMNGLGGGYLLSICLAAKVVFAFVGGAAAGIFLSACGGLAAILASAPGLDRSLK